FDVARTRPLSYPNDSCPRPPTATAPSPHAARPHSCPPEAPPLPPQRHPPLAVTLSLLLASTAGAAGADFQVTPPAVALEGNFARAQLVVTAGPISERSADLTHAAAYASSNPQAVTVSETGLLLARGNGSATVTVTSGGTSRPVGVKVAGVVEK